MSGFSVLKLTDGTDSINLMTNEADGFYLQEYAPIVSGYKGGGVFQDSPLADNRRPVYTRRESVVQPIVLNAKALTHNNMARILQDLLRMLEKAKDYWASDWQNEPVWLEAKTKEETNTRYALVYVGRPEGYPAPYQQPFQQEGGTPVAQEMTLFLEIGQWLDVAPTTEGGASSEITGADYYPSVNALAVWSDDNPANPPQITTPDHVSITDIPSGAFTLEFWAKFTPGAVLDAFAQKSSRFVLTIRNTADTYIDLNFAGGDVRAQISSTTFINLLQDGDWHHLAFTFTGNPAVAARIWIDGVEPAYSFTATSSGLYSGDTGFDFDWFSFNTNVIQKKLELGWMRISDVARYSASFTPPERCVPPVVDGNTILQYNMEEGGGTTLDNAEGTSATDATFIAPTEWTIANNCDITVGAITATTQEVFTANKFVSRSQITNIHIGTAGANVIGGSWPANVFSGTTDTYIGSVDGVFNNIVLNTNAIASTTPTWQYWNGAWTTLSLSNALSNEAVLSKTGQIILSWKPPSDWVAASPGGSLPSGFYVRQTANIGTIQHNGPNDPYTVTWPFVQIASGQLPGDIPNLARMLLRPVGSDGTNNASGAADKIIYGVRSLERGQSFRSHINMSDKGNVSGIFIDNGSGTFINNNQAPTGRLISYTATTSFVAVGGAFINGAISRDYAGRFRAFIRFGYDLSTGSAGSLTWVFRVQYGSNGSYFDSRPVVIDDTYEGSTPLDQPYLLEFSPIHIRSDLLVGTTQEVGEIIFYPLVKTDTGTATVYLHDIVLIPTDEFSGEVERSPQSGQQANALSLIDLDGTNQKLYNRAVKRFVGNNRIEELWLSHGVLPPSLQANVTQRVFFLQRSSATNNPEQSVSWQTLGVRMGKVSRYLGFRGDR